jgi:hypothetical protein
MDGAEGVIGEKIERLSVGEGRRVMNGTCLVKNFEVLLNASLTTY